MDVITCARALEQAGTPYALATVVKIGGSTYRRPGARMVVAASGERWGTISGGCLEGEVAEHARQALDSGHPRLVPFDLADDDVVLGFGAGCNGVVHVFIEPVRPGDPHSAVALVDACRSGRQLGVLATVTRIEAPSEALLGQHLLMQGDGQVLGALAHEPLYAQIWDDAVKLLVAERQEPQPYLWRNQVYETARGAVEVLHQLIRPPTRLLLFGDGHDVRAMVRMARPLGWQVGVVGRKPVDELARRFPEADTHHFLMHPEAAAETVRLDAWSAALIMNHHYLRDRAVLAALAPTKVPYIGLLGPRERTQRMLDELELLGRAPTETQGERIYGPVGLDIGTETPEEIALSAIAEVQAVLHGRSGGSLRARSGPIHAARAPLVG